MLSKKRIVLLTLCIILAVGFFFKNNPGNPVVVFKTHSESYNSIYKEGYHFVNNNRHVVYTNAPAGLRHNTLVFDAGTGDEIFRIQDRSLAGVYNDSVLLIGNSKEEPYSLINLNTMESFEFQIAEPWREAVDTWITISKTENNARVKLADFVPEANLPNSRGINPDLSDFNIENTSSDGELYIVAPIIEGFAGIYSAGTMRVCKIIEWVKFSVKLAFFLSIFLFIVFGIPGLDRTTTVTITTCSGCGKEVPPSSGAGGSCPFCGAQWSN